MSTTAPEKITFSIGAMPDRLAAMTAERLRGMLEELDRGPHDNPAVNPLCGGDPLVAEEKVAEMFGNLQREVRSHVLSWSKATAQEHAKRYPFPGFKSKSTLNEIAVGLGLVAVGGNGYPNLFALRKRIGDRASTVRLRARYIEDAGRTLRYWAGLDVEMVHPGMRSQSAETVEEVLKFYGLAYLRFRGEAADLWTDTEFETDGVEAALRRVGNYALRYLLNPEHNTMDSMVQIRLGSLMGVFYSDMASRSVVKITHGSLDYDRDVDVIVTHDDPRDFVPMYWDGERRAAFQALQP